jgi:ADP-ribosylglycohydrolase
LEFAGRLLKTGDKFRAYFDLQQIMPEFLGDTAIERTEINLFNRLLKADISTFSPQRIKSSGYVLDTLEASIWCILSTSDYREAVLKAVNLGEDTDTTAAVTGGLAGILYGANSIPLNWIDQLARKSDIQNLAFKLDKKYNY